MLCPCHQGDQRPRGPRGNLMSLQPLHTPSPRVRGGVMAQSWQGGQPPLAQRPVEKRQLWRRREGSGRTVEGDQSPHPTHLCSPGAEVGAGCAGGLLGGECGAERAEKKWALLGARAPPGELQRSRLGVPVERGGEGAAGQQLPSTRPEPSLSTWELPTALPVWGPRQTQVMVATPSTLSKQLCVLTGVACVYLTGHRASPLGGREEEEAAVGAGFQGDALPGCELDQLHSGSSGKPRFLPVDLDLNFLKKLPVEPIMAFAAGGGWGLTSGQNVWVWHLSGCPCGRSSLWTEPGLHSLLTLQVDGWTRGQVGAVLGLGSTQVLSAGRGPEAPVGCTWIPGAGGAGLDCGRSRSQGGPGPAR
ncbi:uncharacterized protein [Pseudorca crassidens]|uniref:uncharacterized protein isoform X2 n=1 Tax=Pseudorca crassidens TaxID=82174 RepID=UPI00352EDD86